MQRHRGFVGLKLTTFTWQATWKPTRKLFKKSKEEGKANDPTYSNDYREGATFENLFHLTLKEKSGRKYRVEDGSEYLVQETG